MLDSSSYRRQAVMEKRRQAVMEKRRQAVMEKPARVSPTSSDFGDPGALVVQQAGPLSAAASCVARPNSDEFGYGECN